MRNLLGLCFLLANIPLASPGQTPKKIDDDLVFNRAKYSQKSIPLIARSDKKPEFPFLEKIEVLDGRSDTSCIGFRNRRTEKNNQILQFPLGLKNEFEHYFNKSFIFSRDSNAFKAIIVVRNYWINEFEVDENDADKVIDNRSGKHAFRKTALRATFDIYLTRKNEYFVAYRYDTLAAAFLNIKDFSETYLEGLLEISLKRLQLIRPDQHIVDKRMFTRSELENYYKQRWDKPILKDAEFEKGVYKNFTEFLNNHPSIVRFVVKKDKLVDVLYIPLANEEMTAARDVWGYCDGKKFFIKSGENFYPLVRVQNTFYFLGSKELTKEQDDYYTYDPYTGTNMRVATEPYLRNRLFPMKLDIEKGIVY